MQTTISKWGNSLAIRIPAALAKQAGLSEGCKTELLLKNRQLTVRAVKKKRIRLAEILASMEHLGKQEEMIKGEVGKEASEWVWEHDDEDENE